MPYKSLHDLPEAVKKHLPLHAQEIYKEAFNHAEVQYCHPEKRRNPQESLDQVCHKVAWSAVEKKYTKTATGQWERK